MRTTISLPDELVERARKAAGGRSFSRFAREALTEKVAQLERERVALQMEEGYQHEAVEPSLDPEWASVETDGL